MKFEYGDVIQRSAPWFELRRGRVTASRLCDWLAVSKSKTGAGKPLKARLDYEKELIYERQFGVSYNNYYSDAMQDGVELEDFAVQQYEAITGSVTRTCGIWYSDLFAASPDRLVWESNDADEDDFEDAGLLEVKILRDASFTEVLLTGVPEKHWQQIQGQLFASGKDWCDYVALNLNTRKVKIIRVERDPEFMEYLEAALHEDLVTAEFSLEGVHDIKGSLPEWSHGIVTEGEPLKW